jgi:photosystem II stability/assembly factor-like uncharacterized protein
MIGRRYAGGRGRIRTAIAAPILLAAFAAFVSPANAASSGPAAGVGGPWHREQTPSRVDHLVLEAVSIAADGAHGATTGDFCPPGGCGGLIPSGILTTADGGLTWRKRVVPANVGNVQSVACATSSRCIATALRGPLGPKSKGVFLVTRDAGSSWTVVTLRGAFFVDIACPTGLNCFAVGNNATVTAGIIVATTDGGLRWHAQRLPAGITELNAISCISASRCFALGLAGVGSSFRSVVLTTADGGRNWTQHAVAKGIDGLAAISCPSASRCFATGYNRSGTSAVIYASADGGLRWTAQTAPKGITGLAGVACATPSKCAAVGTTTSSGRAIVATTDGGATWARDAVPTGYGSQTAISCTATGRCLAVGVWDKRVHGTYTDNGPYILGNGG